MTQQHKAQVDVVASIFQSHKTRGPIADAMLTAACKKLDKLGAKSSAGETARA